ncbi:MAG: Lrp/AsnC family transcriptional regulator [Rhizobiaceae bacterium]
MILDNIDKKILIALTKDGRASVEAIAEKVGLSTTPTRRRIKQLESSGVIRGYRADIDPEECGLKMAVYVFVKLQSRNQKSIAKFEAEVIGLDEVQRCDLISGLHDYILTMRIPSMESYNSYLREILAELPGIFGIETSVVIGKVKDSPQLPFEV